VHVRVVLTRGVIQIIKVILQPERILLIVPQECMVEMELWHLGLSICQDDHMRHRGFLLRDCLHRAFFIDFLRHGSRGHWRWWRSSRGCGGISSVVGILFFIFILPMQSSPVSLAISISSSSRDSTIPSRVAFTSSNL
jgi:hypothetical protein